MFEKHVTVSDSGRERRRTPRVEVLGRIHGRMVALDVPITVLEIGRGGFLMRTTVDFPIGATHEFRFTSANCVPLVLHARIVHTLRTSGGGNLGSYVMGLEFSDPDIAELEQAFDSLI